jgi:small subunit ribosomal protein S14
VKSRREAASGDEVTMSTNSKEARFRKQMIKLEAHLKAPDKVKMLPREKIRIRMRCKLCGRPRAVYRKFPGVRKASW